jgi:hypothetical protein
MAIVQTPQYVDPGGWIATGTWVFASATTITVPTDATLTISVGDRIRLKQGAGYLYFCVVAVTATLITITGGSDYTLANATITDAAFSHGVNPVGFPSSFTWAPTLVGFSVAPTLTSFRFTTQGRLCKISVRMGGPGTATGTSFTISLPITALATPANSNWMTTGQIIDNSAAVTAPMVFFAAGATVITINKDFAGGALTNAGTRGATFEMWYEF